MNYSASRISRGFTLVEILVVVAVIGVLATIGIMGFSKVQAGSRDAQRSASMTTLAEALEKYYDQNGEYPSCAALTPSNPVTVTTTVLKGADPTILTAPHGVSGTNSLTCSDLSAGSGPDAYAYIGDGSASCSTGTSCLKYTLKYREETTGNIISLASRHTAAIATSGAATLSATATSYTAVNLSWSLVSNATSYIIRAATDSNFTNAVGTPLTTTQTSAAYTNLTAATTYYFQVAAISNAGVQGAWSNIARATTYTPLAAPTNLVATGTSSSQISVTWATVSDASTYNLEYAANTSFTSSTTITGITGTNKVITGLTSGQAYYFRVYALSTSPVRTSPASATATGITLIDTPSAPSVSLTTPNSSSTTYNWTVVTCSVGTVRYRYQYTIDYSSLYTTNWYSTTALSSSYNTSDEGYQYSVYVQAQCYNSATSSAWSNSGTANYIRPVQPPSAISYSISRRGTDNQAWAMATITCGIGASVYARADLYTGDMVWTDSGQLGWWSNSHGGTWSSPNWQLWGSKVSLGSQRGTAGATMTTGWRWDIAVDAYCGNTTTGRASATIGRHEGPVMSLPADPNQEVFY